jgi:hypothetical protein
MCAGNIGPKAACDMLANDWRVAAMQSLFHWLLRLRNSKPLDKVLLQGREAGLAGRAGSDR